MTTRRALDVLRDVRARVDVPLVPMTYAAPVMAYGERRFCADAAAAGADGLIVPDVPADEAGELDGGLPRERPRPGARCSRRRRPTIASRSPAPTPAGSSTWSRWRGSPAPARSLSDRVAGLAARVRAHTDLPLLVGFGISAPAHAVAALAAGADGVIIGSKAIEVAEAGGPAALAEFIAGRSTAAPVRGG